MRWIAIALTMAVIVGFMGCKEEEKIRDLDFTVVSSECIPPELLKEIEGKKLEPFQLSFRDGNYLYLCAGNICFFIFLTFGIVLLYSVLLLYAKADCI